MTHYAIGDIQGCCNALTCLLDTIQFSPEEDTLWLAGDLVNRGPQSLETLRFVKNLGSRAHVVLGNHDLHLIASYFLPNKVKCDSSLDNIMSAPDGAELVDWLRCQPLLLSSDDLPTSQWHSQTHHIVMTHAGIPHIWSVNEAKIYAKEAEHLLRSPDIKQHLEHLYGNRPNRWTNDLKGYDRFRAIINYFTRMRFCKKDGTLEFKHKAGPNTAPDEYQPWYEYKRPSPQTHHIVFGHWSALEGRTNNDRIHALDTGCVWGKQLTALNLTDFSLQKCDCSTLP